MKKFLFIVGSILILAITSFSQTEKSFLTVKSNFTNAKIYLDSVFVGVTPLDCLVIDSGKYLLKVVYPDESYWHKSIYIDTLIVVPCSILERYIDFKKKYFITSSPYGAKIFYEDSLIGTTPCYAEFENFSPLIKIKKEGYEPVLLHLEENKKLVNVILSETKDYSQKLKVLRNVDISPSVYIAGAGSIIFGSTAAILKVKADKYYKNYRSNGDDGALKKVKEYDKLSGISLVICELSNLVLIYLLLF